MTDSLDAVEVGAEALAAQYEWKHLRPIADGDAGLVLNALFSALDSNFVALEKTEDGIRLMGLADSLVVHWTETGGVDSVHFGAWESCGGEPLYRLIPPKDAT